MRLAVDFHTVFFCCGSGTRCSSSAIQRVLHREWRSAAGRSERRPQFRQCTGSFLGVDVEIGKEAYGLVPRFARAFLNGVPRSTDQAETFDNLLCALDLRLRSRLDCERCGLFNLPRFLQRFDALIDRLRQEFFRLVEFENSADRIAR